MRPGKLSLDAIVGWEPPQTAGGHKETTVTYTYRIAAAEWARNPEAQKVFPMVDRIIKGERTCSCSNFSARPRTDGKR